MEKKEKERKKKKYLSFSDLFAWWNLLLDPGLTSELGTFFLIKLVFSKEKKKKKERKKKVITLISPIPISLNPKKSRSTPSVKFPL